MSARSRLPLRVRPFLAAGLFLIIPAVWFASAVEQQPQPGAPAKATPKGASVEHRIARVSDPDARGAVEVSVAINPTNPDHMVAVSIARMKAHPAVTNYAYVTQDGGRTWKTVPYPNPQKRRQGDDVVTFTADGLAVRAYIAFNGIRLKRPTRADSGILTSTSRDGVTWNSPVAVVDHVNSVEPHEDKPWIKPDVSRDSPHRGNLYVAWTKFDVYGSRKPEHKTHVYFSRSRDGCMSFSVPHRISEAPGDCVDSSNTVMGAVPAVGPKGEVHVVWGGPQGIVWTRSDDGGWTFGKNKVISDTPGGWDIAIKGLGRANGLPSAGVDVSGGKDRGSVYVAWGDKRHGDPDVFLSASRDGGASWSKPLRVNDDPRGNGKEQFFPWLVVDPVDGSVNIAYYDRGPYDGTRTGLTLARSVDGGRTFVHHKINQDPFVGQKFAFFGDYLGLDAFGGRVAVLYMHFIGKQPGISGAVFDFEPGTQQAQVKNKAAH
jgi:hypothetical protein